MSKVVTMVEKIGQGKIGFYCFNFFILNYLHVYEANVKQLFRNSIKTVFIADHCIHNRFFYQIN